MREAAITIGTLLCLLVTGGPGSARQLHRHSEASNPSRQKPVLTTGNCHPKCDRQMRLINPFETEWDVEKWEKALRK